jgi:hypothetical protein
VLHVECMDGGNADSVGMSDPGANALDQRVPERAKVRTTDEV